MMRRFLLKSLCFVFPFFVLYALTRFLYSHTGAPDLLRIGYIPNVYPSYRKKFDSDLSIRFAYLSSSKKKKFKILSIGDSFSDQGAAGYQNILSDSFSILHFDNYISNNPIQTLIGLCNSDFFSQYEFEAVILENVERHLTGNVEKIDTFFKLPFHRIDSIVHPRPEKENLRKHSSPSNPFKYDFFSRVTIEFPLYHLPRYFFNQSYLANG